MSEGDVVKTGIEGLDAIFLGGIPRTNVTVVQGVTGSGKTLMGLEFIYRGITEYKEPGLIVVFEANPDKVIRDAAGFGWNLQELQQQKKLQIIFTTPRCSIRNYIRRIACCLKPRARWEPSGFS
jgi:circadian clock protein KaiC